MSNQPKWHRTATAALLGIALFVSVAALADGTPADLRGLSVAHQQGQPVVTIESNGSLEYETFLLDDPLRMVLDISGAIHRLDQTRWDVDHDALVQIRTAQHRLDPVPVSRIVFDLEQPLDYQVDRTDAGLVVRFADGFASAAVVQEDHGDAAPIVEPATVATAVPAIVNQPQEVAQAERTAAQIERNSGAIEADAIDKLLAAPAFAAPEPDAHEMSSAPASFETKTIVTDSVTYGGKRISLNLVDADIKQVFRLFHEISGINFVLDPSVGGRVTIVVDSVPWDQALDLILKNNGLDKILEGNVIRIATTKKLADEAAQRKQLQDAKQLEVAPVTITRTLSYAKAKDVERVIRDSGVLTQRGKAIVDERTNTLIVSDIPDKVAPIDELISILDTETPQVMIEARVVETSREFVRDLGVVWGFSAVADASRGTQTGVSFPSNASVRYGLNLPGGGAASNLAFSFGNIIDSFTLDVALNALENDGRGRILSSPKIATQNNERAEIEQGIRIPVVNTTATEINVEFVSASLRLEVTPQITAEGTIILDIIVENNSPDFLNTVGDVPPINTQRAQTKVLIGDGGTTVIGGIFTVNEGRSETGVPWFRKVPLFGWLFKTQNITQQNRELLIFITPKIMKLS